MKLNEMKVYEEPPQEGSSVTITVGGSKHVVTVMDEVSGRVYRQKLDKDWWKDPDFHLGAVEA